MNVLALTAITAPNALKILILLCYLLVIAIIIFFNWLYLSRILDSNNKIGLHPPQRIQHLVKASSVVALVTAGFIGIVLLIGHY